MGKKTSTNGSKNRLKRMRIEPKLVILFFSTNRHVKRKFYIPPQRGSFFGSGEFLVVIP